MTVLTVKPYRHNAEAYEVTDADGVGIEKGDYVQVIARDHPFLSEGEIVRVNYAQHGDNGNGKTWASLGIETSRGSTTGVNADEVRCTGNNPEIAKQFRLTYLQGRIAAIEGHIAKLLGDRAGVRYEISQIEGGLS